MLPIAFQAYVQVRLMTNPTIQCSMTIPASLNWPFKNFRELSAWSKFCRLDADGVTQVTAFLIQPFV